MKLEKYEKIVIIILAAALLAGSFVLYKRNSRPFANIFVSDEKIKKEVPLQQIEREMLEARRVNINTASREQLIAIPGIGEKTCAAIMEYRAQHGDIEYIDDLLSIKGIGDKKLKEIKPYLKTE